MCKRESGVVTTPARLAEPTVRRRRRWTGERASGEAPSLTSAPLHEVSATGPSAAAEESRCRSLTPKGHPRRRWTLMSAVHGPLPREDRTWPLPICRVFSSIKGIQVLGKQENLNSITRIFTNSC